MRQMKEEEVVISLSAFLKVLKRFLLIWIVIAIIIAAIVPAYVTLFQSDQYKNLRAMISFNYSGIENGKAQMGASLMFIR